MNVWKQRLETYQNIIDSTVSDEERFDIDKNRLSSRRKTKSKTTFKEKILVTSKMICTQGKLMLSSDESDSSNNEKKAPTQASPWTTYCNKKQNNNKADDNSSSCSNDVSENQLSSKTTSEDDSSKSNNNESAPTELNTKEQRNNDNCDENSSVTTDNDSVNDSSSKSLSLSYKTSNSEASLCKSAQTLCNSDKSSPPISNNIRLSNSNCLVNKNLAKIPIKCNIKICKLVIKKKIKVKKAKKTQNIWLQNVNTNHQILDQMMRCSILH